MWMFWIAAGGLAAAAAALIFARSAAAARGAAAPKEDPALAIYRRQLRDLDALAERGVIGLEELQAAQAEAGRRLLSAADAPRQAERPGGRRARTGVLAAVVATAVTALVLYLKLGSPGLKDEPYQARLAVWRNADPSTLGPAQMAALLRSIAQQRPSDVKAYDYLGRAELAAGHDIAAAEAFRKAIRLAPRRADLRAMLGEALSMDADGAPSPQAQLAFQEALAIDPTNAPARYYLGRAAISAGRIAQGVAIWRSLAAELPPNDTHRQALLAEIDAVTRHGDGTTPRQAAPSGAQGAESPPIPAAQLGFIRAMVAKQAADLNAHPDDPDGWARLVRSYGVLGDRAARSGALARAKQLFAGRPSALAAIQAAASPGRGAN